jgi:hypothetical protein
MFTQPACQPASGVTKGGDEMFRKCVRSDDRAVCVCASSKLLSAQSLKRIGFEIFRNLMARARASATGVCALPVVNVCVCTRGTDV